jgi:hypothetical protein
MMVALYVAGRDDMLVRAENSIRLVLRRQFLIGTDVDDRAIALEYCTVFDNVRCGAVDDLQQRTCYEPRRRHSAPPRYFDTRIETAVLFLNAFVTSVRRRSTNMA